MISQIGDLIGNIPTSTVNIKEKLHELFHEAEEPKGPMGNVHDAKLLEFHIVMTLMKRFCSCSSVVMISQVIFH